MLKPSRNNLAILVLALSAVLLTAPVAMAQHHEDPHATETESQVDPHGTTADPHAADAHGEGHGADAHGGDHSGIPHMANLVAFISPLLPAVIADNLTAFVDPFFSIIVIIVLSLVFVRASKNLSSRNPGRLQMAIEMLVGGLYCLFQTVISPSARRYTPFLGSVFIFI